MRPASSWDRPWLACLLVAAAAALAFLPILGNDFVNWDDPYLLVNNYHLRTLGWPTWKWMFSTYYMGTYQPLGWLSWAVVYALGGMRPQAFHLASLVLHAFAAASLYWLTLHLLSLAEPKEERGRVPAAAFGALVWALSPVSVESVAWASVSTDILATAFFILSILAYLKGVRRGESRGRLALSWVLFACSGLSRWRGVSLPVVLLILDFYPLRRLTGFRQGRVLAEKLPFLALAAGILYFNAGAKGLWDQSQAVAGVGDIAVRILFYWRKILFPFDLSPAYTLASAAPAGWPAWACVLTVACAVGAPILLRTAWPAGLAFLAAYLAGLLPTLPFSDQSRLLVMDHHAYLPCLGLAPLAAGAMLKAAARPRGARAAIAAGVLLLALIARLSWRQCFFWRNSIALWSHALAVDPGSALAHKNLGVALLEDNRLDDAAREFEAALRLEPADELSKLHLARLKRQAAAMDPAGQAEYVMGVRLGQQGRLEEAEVHLRKAAGLSPKRADVFDSLGVALYRRGQAAQALASFRKALELDPQDLEALNNLGSALARQGRWPEAISQFQLALKIDPNFLKAQENLRAALEAQGRPSETGVK